VGTEPVQLAGDNQQLAGRPEPLGLPGGGVDERRCGTPAARRGKKVCERGQVMAESDAACSQHTQRRSVLCRSRLRRTYVTTFTRTA